MRKHERAAGGGNTLVLLQFVAQILDISTPWTVQEAGPYGGVRFRQNAGGGVPYESD